MSSYTEGQVHQLANALEAAGFSPSHVTKLGQFSKLGDIRSVLDGRAEIVTRKHLIDLAADPFVPSGWSVEEHERGTQFEWDSTKVELYLSKNQQNGEVIEGNKLRKELTKKEAFNANLLDYLLANPHLIPEEWKGKAVFFWGTIYRGSVGDLDVRCLCWGGGRWSWGYRWLGVGWGDGGPALVPASTQD